MDVLLNMFCIDTVKQLIFRANVNICNKDGTSPVYLASQTSQALIAYSLLQAGADTHVVKKNGMTTLMMQKNGNSTFRLCSTCIVQPCLTITSGVLYKMRY